MSINTNFPNVYSSAYGNMENLSLKLETMFASRCMNYPSGGFINRSLRREVLNFFCKFSHKAVNIHKKDELDESNSGQFYQNELIKVIQNWNHQRQSWYLTVLRIHFQAKHWAFLQTCYRRNGIWRANETLQLRKNPTHQGTKICHRGKFHVFWRNFQSRRENFIWKPVSTIYYAFCWVNEHFHSTEKQRQRKLCHG